MILPQIDALDLLSVVRNRSDLGPPTVLGRSTSRRGIGLFGSITRQDFAGGQTRYLYQPNTLGDNAGGWVTSDWTGESVQLSLVSRFGVPLSPEYQRRFAGWGAPFHTSSIGVRRNARWACGDHPLVSLGHLRGWTTTRILTEYAIGSHHSGWYAAWHVPRIVVDGHAKRYWGLIRGEFFRYIWNNIFPLRSVDNGTTKPTASSTTNGIALSLPDCKRYQYSAEAEFDLQYLIVGAKALVINIGEGTITAGSVVDLGAGVGSYRYRIDLSWTPRAGPANFNSVADFDAAIAQGGGVSVQLVLVGNQRNVVIQQESFPQFPTGTITGGIAPGYGHDLWPTAMHDIRALLPKQPFTYGSIDQEGCYLPPPWNTPVIGGYPTGTTAVIEGRVIPGLFDDSLAAGLGATCDMVTTWGGSAG